MTGPEEQALELLDRFRNRFYGKYRGIVVEVNKDTLRVKVKVPAVLGQTVSGYCQPCVPYAGKDVGMLFVPQEKTMVWVEFEGGDPSLPILAGCTWRVGELPQDAAVKVGVIVTGAGQRLIFDDEGQTLTIQDQNKNKVTLDSSGIGVERESQKILVGDASVNLNDSALEVT